VIAVDTGYGQMDLRLRGDPRVRLLEKTNARYLTRDEIGEAVDFIAMDVSFISATLVLPAAIRASGRRVRQIVVLVKPQFEVGRELVGKGGIVRDQSAQLAAVAKVEAALQELGCVNLQWIDSPILGMAGNREFLLYCELGEGRSRSQNAQVSESIVENQRQNQRNKHILRHSDF
jgi:23S rRNA (cytidine1920-2'-O)/16S rRNA (cytidine1409-2'-O)-methyltransferase